MNIEIIKKLAVISSILGGIIGIITLIPYLNVFSFLFLTFLAAPSIMLYAQYNNLIGILDTRESFMMSAAVGSCAFTAFFVVFVPISALIGLIYKNGVYVIMKLFLSSGGSIFVLLMSYFMVGFIIALFNAFTGAITTYLYQQTQNKTKENNETFKIDNQG